jgi:hypothetical protein
MIVYILRLPGKILDAAFFRLPEYVFEISHFFPCWTSSFCRNRQMLPIHAPGKNKDESFITPSVFASQAIFSNLYFGLSAEQISFYLIE